MTTSQSLAGAHNLLVNCAGARPGQHLLIAYEPARFGYFSEDVVQDLAAAAASFGLRTSLVDVGFDARNPALCPDLISRMAQADIVVFLSRLGDQLRFSEMPASTTIVTSFTLNRALMQSAFATTHYGAFVSLKTAMDRRVAEAREIIISCPAGTLITGRSDRAGKPADDTTLKRFPLSVFSPVPASGFSGRVALGGFLTGTGSRYYDNYTIEFEGQVYAHMEEGTLAGFEGTRRDVARANAQYDRVANLFGVDRNFVHSWHAGIHPGCGFPWDIRENYDRWGGAAFGNPRVLHFHTCGRYAPGEISWNVFDPTIEIDGERVWDCGRFHAERLPGGAEILDRHPCAARVFAEPDRNVGLRELT